MDDLENSFFQEDQDDIFAAALSVCYSEYGTSSLNSSLLEASQNKCSDKLKNAFISSPERTKVDLKADPVEFLQEKSFYDHRFSLRFTPKAIKRKFAGPAGLILDEDSDDLLDCNAEPVSKKLLADGIDYQNISSSQSSVEELFLSSSWRKLQDEVTSNLSFLSVVKCFSIRRVLSDTSKKKLPKHIIVPALCVYIKEFNPNDPVCVCMDDTGDIHGKIDKEVLQSYSDFIKSGTSLVLKQVTFLCNVLLLQKASLLSFYLSDGSVQHIQDWDAVIGKESPETLNCIHPVTPKLTEKQNHPTETVKETNAKPRFDVNNKLILSENNLSASNAKPRLDMNNKLILSESNLSASNAKPRLDMNNKLISSENIQSASNAVLPKDIFKNKIQNLITTPSNNQDFETDMMDDFDELLGNLDENSLLEEF